MDLYELRNSDYFIGKSVDDRISDLEDERDEGSGIDEEEVDELKTLIEFRASAEGYNEERFEDTTFIANSEFEDYARETAESIGAINGDEGWPLNHIDWESAADDLKMDFTSIDLEGITFWYR